MYRRFLDCLSKELTREDKAQKDPDSETYVFHRYKGYEKTQSEVMDDTRDSCWEYFYKVFFPIVNVWCTNPK